MSERDNGMDVATGTAGLRLSSAEVLILREAICSYGNREITAPSDAWRKLVAWELLERLDRIAPRLGENAP